jgi:phosphate-selective porin OprO/OprP
MRPETRGRRRLARALSACALWAAAALSGGAVRAEDPEAVRALRDQFRLQQQEIDRQTQLIEEMKQRVAGLWEPAASDLPPPPDREAVEKLAGDYLRRRDEERRAHEEAAAARAEAEGHRVGSDLRMSAHWNVLNGVTFETPNKDFTSHLGFWFQYDNVWFTQSASLKSTSQIGDLQDGSFFRRIRPQWEGTAWEVMEWDVIVGLEQISNGVPQFNEVWVGITKLPVIGTVRIGKSRIPQGLEAGTYTGNRPATFFEVSPSGTAFYELLAPGIWTSNSVLDQRVTWQAMLYRQDNDPGGTDSGQNGVSFADGKYACAGRITALPIYENEGRCLLHLGASYGWRKAEDVPATAPTQGNTVGPTFIQFRTRPLLRDGIGDYGNFPANNLSGNQKQLVDTGPILASSSTVIGTELLYVRGPFSLQAEYTWGSANDALVPNPKAGKSGPKNLGLGDVWFDGGYVQLSYFLTGENRRYDRRLGRLSRNTIGSPYTPFWLTRGEDGEWLFGRGAWEVATRWSHLNLDNGPIQGGQTDAFEVGVNWYLNANFKVQFEYLHQFRYDKGTGPNGTLPGDIDGLGIRTQFMF